MLGAGAAEAKQLARPGHGAAAGAEPWSPNGRKIAFHGGNDTSNIYVMNADGSAVRRVAFGWNPAWQPYD
ncbi:MAG: TolB family protein [Gaiellaceae bacterium]